MVMIALSSSLVGAVLGTRFRIQVLFPAVMLGLVVVAIVAALERSTIPTAAAAAIVYTVCLQLGYLGGLLTRFCMAAVRVASHRSIRSTTA
jgi:hypothetical protein